MLEHRDHGRRRAAHVGAETAAQEKDREKAERRAELDALKAEEAREHHGYLVAAGDIFEPAGGWDFDGSDALAAGFGSAQLWEWLDRRAGPPVLELADLAILHTILGLLAEHAGEPVRVKLSRLPRVPEDVRGDRSRIVARLESFRAQMLERARSAGS